MTFTAIAPAGFTAHARSPHLEVAGQPDQFAVPDACGELTEAIWHMLTRNQPFAPAGAGFRLAA